MGIGPGVEVAFDVSAGNGSIQYPFANTDENGIASSGAWKIGNPGVNTVTATVQGLAPVTFTTTATVGNGTQLLKASGDNQVGQRNTEPCRSVDSPAG